MKTKEIRVCIMRVAGTNCDAETLRAFEDLDITAEVVHANQIINKQNLLDYHVLVFPGGFSYGDYVRAGAIFAKAVIAKLGDDLKQFVSEERPILGICNGFQILVESGLLPGYHRLGSLPQAALATNLPIGYRCMWIHLKHENRGRCVFTSKIKADAVVRVPVAHGEGRFIFEKSKQSEYMKKLCEDDQMVFRYCTEDGEVAEGTFPTNPNGSFRDVAGICDSSGTIFGLMPHPERAYFGWQQPDWTRKEKLSKYGDGKLIFESVVEYLTKKF